MARKLIHFVTALLAFSVILSNTTAQSARRPTYDLNVRKPIDAIISKWNGFLGHLDLWHIWLLIGEIAPCLSGLPPLGQSIPHAEIFLESCNSTLINSNQVNFGFQHLQTVLSQVSIKEIIKPVNFDGYCSTPDFKIIHNFIWKEDDQLPDLLSFLYEFGSPDIYDIVKQLYESKGCPQELIDELPNSPPPKNMLKSKIHHDTADLPDLRQEMLKPKTSQMQQCEIRKIIELLPKTGIPELVQFVTTAYHEFTTNPSTHFLVGKIQEPIKGDSVRKFKALEPVNTIIARIDEQLKSNPIIRGILQIIKELTCIDLVPVNIVNIIVAVIINILWPLI